MTHPEDVLYLTLRRQAIEDEISGSSNEAVIRALRLRKLYLEDQLEQLPRQWDTHLHEPLTADPSPAPLFRSVL